MGCESTPSLRGQGPRRGEQGARSTATHTPSTPHSSCVLHKQMLPRVGCGVQKEAESPTGKRGRQEARTPSLCRSPTGGPLTLPLPPKACLLLLCKLINLISCPRAAEKGQEVNKRPQEVRVDQGYTCSSAKGQTVSSFAFITSQLCHCSMSTNGSVLVRLY